MELSNGMQLAMIAIAFLAAIWGGLRLSTLTANANVTVYPDQQLTAYPVGVSKIYRNALVGLNPAGHLKAFVPGDLFAGVAYEACDNSAGTAGAVTCRVIKTADVELPFTSVAQTDVGRACFATSDNALSLTGHFDAYVGRVMGVATTDVAIVRLKGLGERPRNGEGCIELLLTGQEAFTVTGATAGTACVNGFDLKSILGLGWTMNDAEDGGIIGDLDATAEVALLSCRTRNDCLPIDKGVTFDVDLVISDIGDNAATDIDFGLGTALTTNSEADIDHGDMAQLACFHMDGASEDVYFQSDDATTDVAVVDTTINNDATGDTLKHYKIIVRPTGVCEVWVNGVRKLSTTVFAMLSTANVGAFVNVEKTSNDTTAQIIIRNLRVAAGMSALAA